MAEQDVEFVVDDEDLDALQSLLETEGATDVEPVQEAGVLPFVGIVVAAVIALGGLCNIVVKLRQAWTCGVVVDARTPIIQTSKNRDLPRGTVLVFAPDGTQHTLHEPSQVEIEKVVTAA